MIVAIGMLSATAMSQQDPGLPPVFRGSVDVIQVDAYVTDAEGNPVTTLTAEDFELREEGRVQSITHFLPINIPIHEVRDASSTDASRIDADVQSNDGPEGRLYVLTADEMRPESALRSRLFLRWFVERYMGDNDVAAVVLIGEGRRVDTQEFTSNRRLLLRAIDRISGKPGLPPPTAVGFSMPDPRLRLLALQDLVNSLSRIQSRRKAVLLLTEDIGVDVQTAIDTPSSASLPLITGDLARDVARTALRSNVVMYPIDPNGLSLADVVSGAVEAAPSTEMDRARRRLELSRQVRLRSLGEVTGGFALVSSNNLEGTFQRLVRENSAYYSLGYYSTNDKADGKFRRLQVRVKRPGLQVHTINGYLAPKERLKEPARNPGVVDVLSSPLAVSGLPMRIVATPYRGEGGEAIVATALEVDGSAIEFEQKGDTFTANLEIGYVISGATSVTPPIRGPIALTLKADSHEKARKNGIRILLEPRMKPGIYQLRVGLTQTGRRAGSVVHDVEVPDFTRSSLALSAVSLTSVETSGSQFSTGRNMSLETLPGPMTAIRQFASTDRIALYAEVYDNLRTADSHTVTVRAELRTNSGAPVHVVSVDRSSTSMQQRQGGYGFLFEVPLSGVPAGAYVLHVEAKANVGDQPTDSRDVPIRIR